MGHTPDHGERAEHRFPRRVAKPYTTTNTGKVRQCIWRMGLRCAWPFVMVDAVALPAETSTERAGCPANVGVRPCCSSAASQDPCLRPLEWALDRGWYWRS